MPRTSEKSLASNVKGYVKLRAAEARPEKRRFSLPTRFRYGFHIVKRTQSAIFDDYPPEAYTLSSLCLGLK
jgi:hypothetical protein